MKLILVWLLRIGVFLTRIHLMFLGWFMCELQWQWLIGLNWNLAGPQGKNIIIVRYWQFFAKRCLVCYSWIYYFEYEVSSLDTIVSEEFFFYLFIYFFFFQWSIINLCFIKDLNVSGSTLNQSWHLFYYFHQNWQLFILLWSTLFSMIGEAFENK